MEPGLHMGQTAPWVNLKQICESVKEELPYNSNALCYIQTVCFCNDYKESLIYILDILKCSCTELLNFKRKSV